jgi:hypothetical protein
MRSVVLGFVRRELWRSPYRRHLSSFLLFHCSGSFLWLSICAFVAFYRSFLANVIHSSVSHEVFCGSRIRCLFDPGIRNEFFSVSLSNYDDLGHIRLFLIFFLQGHVDLENIPLRKDALRFLEPAIEVFCLIFHNHSFES